MFKLIKPLHRQFYQSIAIRQYHSFCQLKPNQVPKSNQQYKLLFVHPHYANAQMNKSWTFLAEVPTVLMLGYNFMSGWSASNTAVFAGFFSLALLANFVSYTFKSNLIYCVQADKNLQYMYFTLKMSSVMSGLNQSTFKAEVKNDEKYELAQNYYPLKGKLSQIILQDELKKETINIKNSQIFKLERNILRLKIPRNKIRFTLLIGQNQRRQMLMDKQKLSNKELIQKYSKYRIVTIILLGQEEKQELVSQISTQQLKKLRLPKFLILQNLNKQKEGQELLTSLALGLNDTEIINKDESEIKIKQKQTETETEKKQDK